MPFHRLTVPAYFGGLLPGYDYINNALTPATAALADVAKVDGPNIGTYFVAFGEDATSKNTNRANKALAENTDALDDLIHRDLAIPAVTPDAVSGVLVGTITLPGPIFIGMPGTPNTVEGIRRFVTLVDAHDDQIYSGGGECQVQFIVPDVPGNIWSAGNVQLTIVPAIPAGITYRVYYSTRGSAAAFAADGLVGSRRTYNRYAGGPNWADAVTNPPTFITTQLDKIIDDLRAATGTAKIGGDAIAGAPYSTPAGTLRAQLLDIWADLNTLYADLHRVRTLAVAGTLNTPNIDATLILNPAASFNLQLPDPALRPGQRVRLINKDGLMSLTNTVTLVRHAGGVLINGYAGSYVLAAAGGRWTLVSDGTDWTVM